MERQISNEITGLYKELGGNEDIKNQRFATSRYDTKIGLLNESLLYVSFKHTNQKSMNKFLLSHFEDRLREQGEFEYSVFKIENKFVLCYPHIITGAAGPDTFGTYFSFFDTKEELKEVLEKMQFSDKFMKKFEEHDFFKRRSNSLPIQKYTIEQGKANDYSNNFTSRLSEFAHKILSIRHNIQDEKRVESDIKPK